MKYPNWLLRIPHFDKILHALGCLALYGFFRIILFPPGFAMFMVVFTAGLKEILDGKNPLKHTSDLWDFLAGVGPVVPIFLWEAL